MTGFRIDENGALVNAVGARAGMPEVIYSGCVQGGNLDTGNVYLEPYTPDLHMVRVAVLCNAGTFQAAFGGRAFTIDGLEYNDGNHIGSWSKTQTGWNYVNLGSGPINLVFEVVSGGGGYWAGRVYGSLSENQQVEGRVEWEGANGKVRFDHHGSADWAAVLVEGFR